MLDFKQTEMTLEYACGHTETYTFTTVNVEPGTEKVPFDCPSCSEEQELLECYACGGNHRRDEAVITKMGVNGCRNYQPEIEPAEALTGNG